MPLAPFVASDFKRIYIVVADTLPPLCVTVTELANPEPLDNDTSYPVGALTVMFAVRFDPLTVRVCVAEAEPAQAENAVSEPVREIVG